MFTELPDHVETVKIENTCTCEYFECPECGEETYENDYCEECEHSSVGSTNFEPNYDYNCSGLCWDLAVEDLESLWERFKAAVPTETGYYTISGKDMGWLHRSGQRIVEEDWQNVYELISVNSEWTQYWMFDPIAKTLVATQSHHDAPTGESYTFAPSTEIEVAQYDHAD